MIINSLFRIKLLIFSVIPSDMDICYKKCDYCIIPFVTEYMTLYTLLKIQIETLFIDTYDIIYLLKSNFSSFVFVL